MAVSFVRQLGYESGVQLNVLRDSSEVPSFGNDDQVFGIIMAASRGRIDRPFLVDRSNITRRLGRGASLRASKLNMAYIHVHEAINKGAYQAVVQRMVGSGAKLQWIVGQIVGDGVVWKTVDNIESESGAYIAIRHHECYNDGIVVGLHADQLRNSSQNIATKDIELVVNDPNGVELYTFKGSLDPEARDDFNNSSYLPTVVSVATDNLEIVISQEFMQVQPTSNMYGQKNGRDAWVYSGVQSYFTEGDRTYSTDDVLGFVKKMRDTEYDYAYISAGGSEDVGLLSGLANLAYDTNRQLRFDIPGHMTPEQAMRWVEQLNMGASPVSHLMHAFWSPFKSDDPTGVNGSGYYGTATLNIAMACRRNAEKNAQGFSRKNYPIAGRHWPIQRTRMVQTYFPESQELSWLAKAKINPVISQRFSGGTSYVFLDSVTCALVDSSLKKLISVADMSTSIDEFVTRLGKDVLQLPMQVAIQRMKDALQTLFESAEASGWLVPSELMDGSSFKYEVYPDQQRPYDTLHVDYWLRYDGVARQIIVQQTITR